MKKWFREIDSRFSWSFLGFLIGILGLAFGLYTFFQKDRPELQFEVITNTDIININENIGKLQIFFDNENVLSIDTTLRLLTIKLSNYGNSSINKNDFDKDYLLGLDFKNYIIADKPNTIEFSNDYLQERFNFSFDSSSIKIAPVIFDKNDYVLFKLLLIGPRQEPIRISTTGKISGQSKIQIITNYKASKRKSLKDYAQDLLLFGSSLVGFAIFTIIVEFIKSKYRKNKKEKIIKKLNAKFDIQSDKDFKIIVHIIYEYGTKALNHILSINQDAEKLEKFGSADISLKHLTYLDLKYLGLKYDSKKASEFFREKTYFDELLLDERIIRKGGKIIFSESFIQKIKDVNDFLKN